MKILKSAGFSDRNMKLGINVVKHGFFHYFVKCYYKKLRNAFCEARYCYDDLEKRKAFILDLKENSK